MTTQSPRRLVLYMLTTMDGFIARPNGELDLFPVDDELMRFANELFSTADGIVFGRVAYQGFVSYWDSLDLTDASIPKGEVEFASIFRNMKRIVVSRTLKSVDGDAILIKGDIAARISDLKRQPGRSLLLVCGPELLSTLAELGLIDEYRILVCPIALGHGKPLFGDIQDVLRLKLVNTTMFDSGAIMLDYEPGGNRMGGS